MFEAEEQGEPGVASRVNKVLYTLGCRAPKRLSSLPRGVPHMQNNVRDRIVVELAELGRQFQSPSALGACAFEGQQALVAKVGLEHSAVFPCAAGNDRLNCAEIVDE